MIPENDMDRLHPSSRVNYMKKYTIEHNYPVNFVGHLHRADYMNLQEQLQQIQSQPESSSVFEYGGMPE
ncbi:hypothetical protein CMQ_6222 [Grosmannia clavigera kw1407]|uniref:DUF6590 domain-containing protein n=1 Tax=Grosmannia clavigera (strain kw1407 / UAMH 11150) TaxID=655863 RepID=F0XM06_GROCL|nr:uncharacterized protein CMQ_6222 [Grosmannia clavigera kw1407]EFX01280.1 hypothetical protein CMQ_6222 [Grosmannia clavigera kw1407]